MQYVLIELCFYLISWILMSSCFWEKKIRLDSQRQTFLIFIWIFFFWRWRVIMQFWRSAEDILILKWSCHSNLEYVLVKIFCPNKTDTKFINYRQQTTIFNWNENKSHFRGPVVHRQKCPPNLGRMGCVS